MKYWVDLDNTLGITVQNDYQNAIPIYNRINKINRLFDEGHQIVIWTGRGFQSGLDWLAFTKNQLMVWGVKYTELIVTDKPDCVIDDIAIHPVDFFDDYEKEFDDFVEQMVKTAKDKGQIFIAGNGGLDSESQHFAAELVGKYAFDVYIPCKSLTENSSIITALANDIGYQNVFAHQVKVWGIPSDIFIGMTTSKSENIMKALETARSIGMTTAIICSQKPFEFDADYVFRMNGKSVSEIQEYAIRFLHKLAYETKKKMMEENNGK